MKFKTEPYAHQLECYNETRERTSYGIFWEMGCGKSKTTLDTAAWQYLNGYIDTLLVVAPKGVHRNWVTETTRPSGIRARRPTRNATGRSSKML